MNEPVKKARGTSEDGARVSLPSCRVQKLELGVGFLGFAGGTATIEGGERSLIVNVLADSRQVLFGPITSATPAAQISLRAYEKSIVEEFMRANGHVKK